MGRPGEMMELRGTQHCVPGPPSSSSGQLSRSDRHHCQVIACWKIGYEGECSAVYRVERGEGGS